MLETFPYNDNGLNKSNASKGHYLGQLICSPYPILDKNGETPAELHRTDGGVVSSSQYDGFTSYLKKLASLYPAVSKTEAEWQDEKTKYGEVNAFVIDDEAGTIRLPLIVNPIKGVTDLSQLGQVIEAGLPNIEGAWFAHRPLNPSGCVKKGTKTISDSSGANINIGAQQLIIDASLSNPIYGKSDTVQPQQPTGCYYIVLATGTTEDYTALEEYAPIEVHSILEPKWSDKKLNNPAWIRSNGQWNQKSVYEKEFNHLLLEYNGAVDETETVSGVEITFRRGAGTEMKITTDKSAYDAILATTGTSWYYVLDIANEQFCLPQTNGFFQCASSGAGDFVEAGLPSIEHTHTFPLTSNESGAYDATAGHTNLSTITTSVNSAVSEIYGKSDTVQPPAVKGYLYFYAGNVTQNASVINAGRMQEQLVDLASRVHVVETQEYGLTGYRVWSDGRREEWGEVSVTTTQKVDIKFIGSYKTTNYRVERSQIGTYASPIAGRELIQWFDPTTKGFSMWCNNVGSNRWYSDGY